MKKFQLHMTEKQSAWLRSILLIVGTTVLSLLMTVFIIYDFTSLEAFAPANKKVNFLLSDVYNAVDEKRAVMPLAEDVIVVNIDGCDRKCALEVLNRVSALGPKAIGLDVFFSIEKDELENAYLMETLEAHKNLVIATSVSKVGEHLYHREPLSFFETDSTFKPAHWAYVNLDIDHTWEVVRTFVPYVHMDSGKCLSSMAVEVAKIAAPERVEELLARGNEEELIDFTSSQIEVITAAQLDTPHIADRLRNRVVMIGALSDNKDIYLTPLHDPVAGVLIHAHIAQTILSSRYIRESSIWLNWFIAILLCAAFVTVMLLAQKYMSNLGNLLIRISQFAIMFGLVWFGCAIYSGAHLYMDFTPAILMLGFGAVAFDIVFAFYAIIRKIITKIHTISHKQ